MEKRGWDGWMASLSQWASAWASFRSWGRTGKLGELQSMGLQRPRHNWVTEKKKHSTCSMFLSTPMVFWRRKWQPTPVLLPGKSHGQRSLVGYSPSGLEELGTTEQLHFYFSLSCIGEGNGNPLQCSCLENPRDRGAWWAAVYGVAQGRTQLKWLSSCLVCCA